MPPCTPKMKPQLQQILYENEPIKVKLINKTVKVSEGWYNNADLNILTRGIIHKFQQKKSLTEVTHDEMFKVRFTK